VITFIATLVLADTPEKTVQAFVDSFNAHDNAGLTREIYGGKPASIPRYGEQLRLKVTLGATKIEGDEATVEADVEMNSGASRSPLGHEAIRLRRSNGNWGIVSSPPSNHATSKAPYVEILAYLATNPQMMGLARTAAKKTACLSNVKQLALGTIMYASDHKDVLPTAAAWKASIMPYVKNEKIFHCPDDAAGGVSYFLDPRVSGKPFAALAFPAETAMIVEGTPKKTAFRHAGKASLGFVDGHAKSVDAATLLKARTKPLR
jgi:prepilin-type processing-associated H-X9-DG protein